MISRCISIKTEFYFACLHGCLISILWRCHFLPRNLRRCSGGGLNSGLSNSYQAYYISPEISFELAIIVVIKFIVIKHGLVIIEFCYETLLIKKEFKMVVYAILTTAKYS